MGFFDKLKKKKDGEGGVNPSLTGSSPADLSESEGLDSSEMDIDSISIDDADSGGDSLQSFEESFSDSPLQSAEQPTKKFAVNKKILLAVFGLFLFLVLVISAVVFWFTSNQTYPDAKKLCAEFFDRLNQGQPNRAYSYLDKAYRDKVSDAEFRYMIQGSSFLFEKMKKVEPDEKSWVQKAKDFRFSGKIFYDDKTEADFNMQFIKRKEGKADKLYIVAFSVDGPMRRERKYQAAYRTVSEFTKTFDKGNLENFIGFFHQNVKDSIGREANARLSQLHQRLVEVGFQSHGFSESSFSATSNVELVYTGESVTKLGSKMKGTVTLFYDKGNWYVIAVDFKVAGS